MLRFEPAGKCATIIYPNMCLQDRFREWLNINKYFKLHPRVKSIADGFTRKFLKGMLFSQKNIRVKFWS